MHGPLRRQARFQRHDGRFGDVVRHLRLRVVHTVCRDGGGEGDAPAGPGLDGGHVFGDGLRAEKGAHGVDIQSLAPLLGAHLEGVEAADNAGEAKKVVECAHRLGTGFDGFGDGVVVRDIDADAQDALGGEVGGEGEDGGLGGAECGFKVPEAEAGGAVFEEGASGGEAEGAGATGD